MYALPVDLPCLPTLYLWVPCSARRVFDASQVPVVGVVAVAVNAPKRRDFRGLDGTKHEKRAETARFSCSVVMEVKKHVERTLTGTFYVFGWRLRCWERRGM